MISFNPHLVDNKTPDLSINTSPEKQSNHLTKNLTSLLNLPVELRRNIASYLNANEYASLRETCSTFRNDLYSFEKLNIFLEKAQCKGSFKKNAESIINDIQRSKLKKEIDNNPHIKHVLSTLRVESLYGSDRGFQIFFKAYSKISTEQKNNLRNAFTSITGNIGSKFAQNHFELNYKNMYRETKIDREINQDYYAIGFDMNNIDYNSEDIFPADLLFESFQTIFDKKTTLDKYIVASYAAKMMQIWKNSPPRNNDISTVDKIGLSHKKLISMGEWVNSIIK